MEPINPAKGSPANDPNRPNQPSEGRSCHLYAQFHSWMIDYLFVYCPLPAMQTTPHIIFF